MKTLRLAIAVTALIALSLALQPNASAEEIKVVNTNGDNILMKTISNFNEKYISIQDLTDFAFIGCVYRLEENRIICRDFALQFRPNAFHVIFRNDGELRYTEMALPAVRHADEVYVPLYEFFNAMKTLNVFMVSHSKSDYETFELSPTEYFELPKQNAHFMTNSPEEKSISDLHAKESNIEVAVNTKFNIIEPDKNRAQQKNQDLVESKNIADMRQETKYNIETDNIKTDNIETGHNEEKSDANFSQIDKKKNTAQRKNSTPYIKSSFENVSESMTKGLQSLQKMQSLASVPPKQQAKAPALQENSPEQIKKVKSKNVNYPPNLYVLPPNLKRDFVK